MDVNKEMKFLCKLKKNWGESQGRCERRSGVFLKIQRKNIYTCIFFFGGGVGLGGMGWSG